jgi:hypothetical protein
MYPGVLPFKNKIIIIAISRSQITFSVAIENVVYNLRCLDQYKSLVLMPLGN